LKLTFISRYILIGLLSSLSLFYLGCQDPPLKSFEDARSALETAARAGALRYAEPVYREAESLLQNGLIEMARQKGRLGPFRNFKTADSLYHQSIQTADRAVQEAQARISELQTELKEEQLGFQTELGAWRDALDNTLMLNNAESYWSSADLALRTCERLILENEYIAAIEAVSEGRRWLVKLSQTFAEYDNDIATKIQIWRRWVNDTLEQSRISKGSAIIVDKSAHKLYLVQGGKLLHSFDCELGYNSARHKFFSGDGATPEGIYQITKTRPAGSKYHKALLINYPNEQDKSKFAENRARGIISRYARIGGLIEIHGDGGRGKDWTEGCVALTNKDMDRLMQYAAVGTPVTIVRRSDRWP